ncbi:carboxylesterase, type B [Aspergillus ibericus CBS 121593]|uniref:Carboxylic ester hydrolase n=1 Tax=Aspergillus ibericus CBS 121593 TaxID=1448316 RepID=A0A395GKB7_9EURO|nr:carboxylesterase, type B [Aspergillus ibericus CBS 121593]RAK95854.1 carboxylesterase, type B [Aspergillus ibericus CBS 121593]
MKISASLASVLATATAVVASASASNSLRIQTSSGVIQGGVNGTYPAVRQFLGIPFAQAPVGNRRWLPPQELNKSDSIIDATTMPPACPQGSTAMSPFGRFAPETLIAGGTSEDCLTLSVWAPNNAKSDLPVIVWIYGGEFTSGGTDTPAWIPSQWIQRTQEHIVVSIQYRLNIFGFPGARGLAEQNLGILDQRAAIEWLQKNIAQFGGNPDQMILWGQSAGAGSVDIQNFAYPDDPIVQGFACDSGSVFLTVDTRSTDTAGTNFSTVASHFGCSGSAADELSCLRQVPAANITSYLGAGGARLTFLPFIDNKVVFNNYTARYIGGHLSNKPALFGSNLNEGTILAGGSDNAMAEAITLSGFQCPVPYSTAYRQALDLTTYRYQYRGNFSNVSPSPSLGAYHTAELPLIFGTSGDFYGANTPFEAKVSEKMQDLWLAFAKDPANGLAQQGWPKSTSNEFLMLAGEDASNKTVVSALLADSAIDDACTSYYSSYLV